jgi:hypothetical protein
LQAGLDHHFLFLTWQGLGGGFTANPWTSMISKIIPPKHEERSLAHRRQLQTCLSARGGGSRVSVELVRFAVRFHVLFFDRQCVLHRLMVCASR